MKKFQKQTPKKIFFHAFTLVELIVVIVILSILATIAFLSFNSYSSSSRDSVRLSDINSLNKSLELFNISAAKYPDPTNVYTRVVYSGGVIFEQGSVGDSVITAVQKVSKKPIDPLDSGEYTYSTNLNRTSFQLKGTLENKLSTGYNDIIENSIPHLTPAYRQAGPSNIGEELISSIFPLTRENTRGLFDGMTTETNADTNSGSRICYVKGNFNGLIEKTNTGNTNYILAVPGLIVNETNLNLDYNTLSGKVVCNGLSNPCIIEYTPKTVFIGEDNAVPTTSSDITDIMINLQSAYSGSNVSSSNTTISNLLSSSGSSLVSLGSSLVSKVGVTSSNIVVNNANCTATSYNGYNISALSHGNSSTFTRTGSTAGGTRTYTIQANCNNGTISYGVETISVSCNSGFVQSAGYTCIAATCNGSIADANGHSTATSQSNLQSWAYNSTPGVCSWDCNTNYSRNGSSCQPYTYPGCNTPDIILSNGQIWSACNVGATNVYNGISITDCTSSVTDCNSGLRNMLGGYYQWGRNNNVAGTSTTSVLAPSGTLAGGVGHSNFIINTIGNLDWITTRNDNLWGGSGTNITSGTFYTQGNPSSMQGPCANGYHIPTILEWCNAIISINPTISCNGLGQSDSSVVSNLKLSFGGFRFYGNGYYGMQSSRGYYRSASTDSASGSYLRVDSENIYPITNKYRAYGFSVRCIRN